MIPLFDTEISLGSHQMHRLQVPMLPNVTESCETIAELFLQRITESPWKGTWSPCLPFVSQFRAQRLGTDALENLGLKRLNWVDDGRL
jgi:hypothetical protein